MQAVPPSLGLTDTEAMPSLLLQPRGHASFIDTDRQACFNQPD